MQIEGVPEQISRTAYIEMIKSLGLDPTRLKRMTFDVAGVFAVVIAKNENGKSYFDPGNPNEIAVHEVFIPVKP